MNQLPIHLHRRLEDVIHSRFFHRIEMYELYLWLDNFKPEEYDMAISVLEHVDFYRESDFLSLLWRALVTTEIDLVNSQLYFIPVGEAGKSGDMVVYQINKLIKSNRLNAKCCYSCKDLEGIALSENDYVFFVDDFIGSGGSFEDYIIHNPFAHSLLSHTNVILLCGIILEFGKRYLEKCYSKTNLRIAAGVEKYRSFESGHSVFGSFLRTKRIREYCYDYGKKLYKDHPLGYKNSQSLVIIEHSSPNNSLPILWSNNSINGRAWNPLVPRSYKIKEDRACIDRKDNNRWLYLLRRTIGVNEREDLHSAFTNKNYTLIMILRFLMDKKPESYIANTLGLTPHDIDDLKREGVERELWDENWMVFPYVVNQYNEAVTYLNRKAKDIEFDLDSITDDRNNMFIPETFRVLK